MITINSKEI